MKRYFVIVRENKMLNKNCIICNNNFLVSNCRINAKYCSQKCMGISYQKIDNRLIKQCVHCKKEFKTYQQNIIHCSLKCRDYRKMSKCLTCNKEFFGSHTRKFCSKICADKFPNKK